MLSAPTTRSGDALVVFEGPGRIAWARPDLDRWTPLELWPNAHQAEELRLHLASKQPLLVVLDRADAVVSLLPEELDGASPAMTALADEPTGDLVRLRLPTLDWLPDDLRRRGMRFLSESLARTSTIPKPLLPALVFDTGHAAAPHVRFAHRLNTRVSLDYELDAIVEHCFGRTRCCSPTRCRAFPA